jgi:pyruvate dehydrogenase E1 component beta subunit
VRPLKYSHAVKEAHYQLLERDERVFLIGQGVNSPWYVGESTTGLVEIFGSKRVVDCPVSENATTGLAIGAAIAGMRPIILHPRMDFMLYAMDQIVNHAAKFHYMLGGKVTIPVTIRGIINRGGEQAAQHSQSLQAIFMHVPGLKVVLPATPYDAKGLLIASVEDDNPVVYIDDRWLYNHQGQVPKKYYSVPIGKGEVRMRGKDVTIAATSYMVCESLKAAKNLGKEGISVEVVDLRSIKPLDKELLFKSVKKTGRLVVVDGTWKTGGVAAEVCAQVATEIFNTLEAPVLRVTLPDAPAPASSALEKAYYPTAAKVQEAVHELVDSKR